MRFDKMSTNQELMQEIGRRLKQYRVQANLTQDEVAGLESLNVKTVSRAENGEDPKLSTLISILRALGRIQALESFLPDPLVSPMAITDSGKSRSRVRK